jgi:hypothetical protein
MNGNLSQFSCFPTGIISLDTVICLDVNKIRRFGGCICLHYEINISI